MTERFYVKGSHIKCKGKKGWLTIDEICRILNNYDQLLKECESEFRRYDGRKLFDLEYIIFAEILGKLTEVLDPK